MRGSHRASLDGKVDLLQKSPSEAGKVINYHTSIWTEVGSFALRKKLGMATCVLESGDRDPGGSLAKSARDPASKLKVESNSQRHLTSTSALHVTQ